MNSPNHAVALLARFKVFAHVASIISIAVGCIVLLGWLLGIDAFKTIIPGLASMKPNTAILFAMCGLSLWLTLKPPVIRGQLASWAGWLGGLIVVAVAAITAGQDLFGWNLGIDHMVIQAEAGSAPNALRMSEATALCFVLVGISLIVTGVQFRRSVLPGQWLAIVTLIIAAIAVLGYWYGVQSLYRLAAFSSMALHTALTFMVLASGVLCIYPDRGLMSTLTGDTLGGLTARRLLPVSLAVIIVLGWLRLTGQNMGLYDTSSGSALLVISVCCFLSVVVWINARTLNLAEQELRKNEERFRSVVESMPAALVAIDASGVVRMVNSGISRVFGYTPEELVGKPVGMLVPERLRGDHGGLKAGYFAEPSQRSMSILQEVLSLRKDGTEFPAEIALGFSGEQDKPLTLAFINDITERQQAEARIAHQSRLIDQATDAIISMDMQFNLVSFNAAAVDLYGWDLRQYMGKSLTELFDTEYLDVTAEAAVQELLEKGIWSGELSQATNSGRRVLVQAATTFVTNTDGERVGVVTVNRDITHRKLIEEQLKESQEKFSTSFQSSPVAIAITTLEGIYVDINQAFCDLIGYSYQEIIGRSSADLSLATPESRKQLLANAEAGQGALRSVEFTGRAKGGEVRHVLMSTETITLNGQPHSLSTLLDITARKQAEEALRKESSILDMAHVLIRDLDSRIVFWNTGAERLYGWSREEALGKVSHAIHETEFPMPLEDIMAAVYQDGEWEGELIHTCKDGSKVTVASHWVLYRNEKGEPEGVLETNNDITALKAAERQIIKVNRLYAVLSGINEAIVRLRDPGELFERACHIAIERGQFKMAWIGLTDPQTGRLKIAAHGQGGELIKQLSAALEAPAAEKLPIMDTVRTGQPTIINDAGTDPRLGPVGKRVVDAGYYSLAAFPLNVLGATRGVFALYSAESGFFDDEQVKLLGELAGDISFAMEVAEIEGLRQEAEQKVRASQERLQSTLDHMMEGCQIIDFDWRYYYINEMAATHGRLDTSKLLGNKMTELYPGIEGTDMFRALEKCMTTREPHRMVNEFSYPDGASQWFELSIQPAPEDVFILSTDITARKNAEDQLHHLNTELEQRVTERTAQLEARTKELESFSYSVSHDLKAPLRGIDGYSRLLLEEHADKLNDEGKTFINSIRKGAQQMNQLIEDLLAYSRLERREIGMGQVSPLALIESLVYERQDELKDHTTTVDIPQVKIDADPDGLAMAMRNLVDNAIKFTRGVPGPSIQIAGHENGSTFVISVRDNGIGFDMKFHDRIFSIFQRLHRVEDYPGTGVGLAIVNKAMERMGGRVWAESEPGHGATFYLELPRSQ